MHLPVNEVFVRLAALTERGGEWVWGWGAPIDGGRRPGRWGRWSLGVGDEEKTLNMAFGSSTQFV